MKKPLLIFLLVLICTFVTPAQSRAKVTIPNDFVVTFGEAGEGGQRLYKISHEGLVSYYFYSNLPQPSSYASILGQKNSKQPKLKERLTAKQLGQIIDEIERSGFFDADHRGCVGNITTDSMSVSVTVRRDGETTSRSNAGDCERAMIASLYTKLAELIKGVRAAPVSRDEFFASN